MTALQRSARPYTAAFVSGARSALREPSDLVVRVGFYLVVLVVLASLWHAVFDSQRATIAGYDFHSIIWYLAAAEGAVIAIAPRLIEDIGFDIGDGSISVEMLRPASVVGLRLAIGLGESLVRLGFALVTGAVFILIVAGPPPSLVGLLLALPAAVLGVACNLALQHALAGAAFWLDDAKSTWFLYQKLVFLLGGMLLPLEFYPGWLTHAALFMPFMTAAYAPARLAGGHIELWLPAVQVAWLGVLLAASFGVFRAGERRMQAVGG